MKLLFAAFIAAAAAVWLWSFGGTRVEVRQNGQVIAAWPITEDRVIRVESQNGGYNIVKSSGGSVAVAEANCPNKLCVNTGAIHTAGASAVCLPHRLSVRISQ